MTDPTDLTPAEQAAYGPIYEAAHSIDHSMLRLVDGATCQRCESTARAVVAAQERASGPETPQGHPSEGTGVPGPHGAAQAADLTPAEQAASEAIVEYWTPLDGEPDLTIEDVADEARAIVAAVRPLIEADALDALADAATTYGPPTVDHLRGIAFTVRQARTSVRDWLAADTEGTSR